MKQQRSQCGFYGKFPSQGDFVSRRLAPAFVRCWDSWLETALTCSRKRLGDHWEAAYLCSPIWRFALSNGVCGEPSWAGVLMPSVDRVGRYFPLTLACGGAQASPLDRLSLDGEWYAQLETLALSSLHESFCVTTFDTALLCLDGPSHGIAPISEQSVGSAGAEYWLELPEGRSWKEVSMSLRRTSFAGRVLFWSEGSRQIPRSLLVSSSLPSERAFTQMLSGQRAEY